VWAPDGRSLYFTSDRAGSAQIYQIGAQPGARPKRITFGGSYNARRVYRRMARSWRW